MHYVFVFFSKIEYIIFKYKILYYTNYVIYYDKKRKI